MTMRKNRRRSAAADSPTRKKTRNPLPADAPISYHDTALLRRFLSDRGKIRSRHVTGLDPAQQRKVVSAIKNAREMALLPYPR